MKSLIPLVATAFLAACAVPNPTQVEPEYDPVAEEQCYTDCEYIHAGEIRACVRRPAQEGRGVQFSKCVNASYKTLGACYQACAGPVSDKAE